MTEAVRIFMDVDGVLNAYSGKPRIPSWGWPRETGKMERVLGFLIVWSTEMLERLRAITDRDDVSVAWLTTWQDNARNSLAPVIGLGEDWPVVDRRNHEGVGLPWWKLHAIQTLNDDFTGRIVWVDDDINFSPDAKEWLEETDYNILAICPRTETGITMAQMRKIEEFVA